jgi:hypothetical protein
VIPSSFDLDELGDEAVVQIGGRGRTMVASATDAQGMHCSPVGKCIMFQMLGM